MAAFIDPDDQKSYQYSTFVDPDTKEEQPVLADDNIGTVPPVRVSDNGSSANPEQRMHNMLTAEADRVLHKSTAPEIKRRIVNLAKVGAASGQSLGQSIDNAINFVARTHLKAPQVIEPSSPAGRAGGLLGGAAGFELGGMAGAPLAGALPGIRALPGIAKRALGYGALSGAMAPEGQRGESAALGGAISPLADVAGAAAQPKELLRKAVSKLIPKRTPEAMRSIQEAVPEGIKMPAGDIMQSSPLLRAQQTAESIPFSGMNKPYQQLNKHVKDYGEQFTKSLAGSDVKDLNSSVYNELKTGYLKKHKAYEESLDSFFDEAAKTPLPKNFSLTNLKNVIDDSKEDFNDELEKYENKSIAMKRPGNKAYMDVLNHFSPKNISFKSFSDFEGVKKDLNEVYSENLGQKTTKVLPLVGKLKSALKEDLTENASNNSNLKTKLAASDRLYSKGVIPYQKRGNAKSPFMKTYEDPDEDTGGFINKYLSLDKKGDKHQQLTKLLQLSDNPEKTRQLVLSHHLKPSVSSENEVNPGAMVELHNKLGDNQKKVLFGKDATKFKQLALLKKTFPETFGIDFTPKTGFRALRGAFSHGEMPTAAVLTMLGHPLAAAALVGGPIAASRGVSKLLQSDILPRLAMQTGKGQAKSATSKFLPQALRSLLLGGTLTRGNQ